MDKKTRDILIAELMKGTPGSLHLIDKMLAGVLKEEADKHPRYGRKFKMDDEFRSYNKTYDAYYSKSHDEWKEKVCSDIACIYCATRPDRPSDILEIAQEMVEQGYFGQEILMKHGVKPKLDSKSEWDLLEEADDDA